MLEQLFKATWLEKRPWHALFIGGAYSFLSYFSALIVFPGFVGLASIAFLSVLLVPSINALLLIEEKQDVREKKLDLKQLFKDHSDIIETYLFLFIGILLAYAIITLIIGFGSEAVFKEQLSLININGYATTHESFQALLGNNLVVFIVFLVLSLGYGAGSVLFLAWNASAWGVIFGYFAFKSAIIQGVNPLQNFFMLLLKVSPHTFLEALAYLLVVFAGGVVSKAVLREKAFSKRFNHVVTDGLIITCIGLIPLIIAAILESRL